MQKARFPHGGHALRTYDRSNGSFVEKVPDTFDLRHPAKQSFLHLPAYTASSKRYRIRSIFAIQQSEASRTFSSHCMHWPSQRLFQHECGQTQEVEVPRPLPDWAMRCTLVCPAPEPLRGSAFHPGLPGTGAAERQLIVQMARHHWKRMRVDAVLPDTIGEA